MNKIQEFLAAEKARQEQNKAIGERFSKQIESVVGLTPSDFSLIGHFGVYRWNLRTLWSPTFHDHIYVVCKDDGHSIDESEQNAFLKDLEEYLTENR